MSSINPNRRDDTDDVVSAQAGSHPDDALTLELTPPEATHAGRRIPDLSHKEITAVMLALMPTLFLAAVDQTIVATALPTIGANFNNVADLSWVVSAYLLASTASAPVFGTLSDIYGRRVVMLSAIGLFLVGSVLCAIAPNMICLILARALQGIGGGGILPLVQTTVSDVMAPRERGKYQGYLSAVWVSAGTGGPVLGGFFAQHLHWSMIFWINLPIGLMSIVLLIPVFRMLPKNYRARRLDILGGLLVMASAVAIMLVLTWGGHAYAWLSPTIIAMTGASVLFAMLFVWHSRRTSEPFIPVSMLGGSVLPYSFTAGGCALGVSVALAVYMPLYFQGVYGLDATQSGWALIPVAVGVVPGATLGGQATARLKRYKRVAVLGNLTACVMLAVVAFATPLPLTVLLVLLAIGSVGLGTSFPMSVVTTQNAVAKDQVGTATGALSFARALMASLIVALFSAILLGSLGHQGNLESLDLVHVAQPEALISAYRGVFAAAAGLMAIGSIAWSLMEERRMPGKADAKAASG